MGHGGQASGYPGGATLRELARDRMEASPHPAEKNSCGVAFMQSERARISRGVNGEESLALWGGTTAAPLGAGNECRIGGLLTHAEEPIFYLGRFPGA